MPGSPVKLTSMEFDSEEEVAEVLRQLDEWLKSEDATKTLQSLKSEWEQIERELEGADCPDATVLQHPMTV